MHRFYCPVYLTVFPVECFVHACVPCLWYRTICRHYWAVITVEYNSFFEIFCMLLCTLCTSLCCTFLYYYYRTVLLLLRFANITYWGVLLLLFCHTITTTKLYYYYYIVWCTVVTVVCHFSCGLVRFTLCTTRLTAATDCTLVSRKVD